MTLNRSQIEQLNGAIRAYDYPAVTYDFVNAKEVTHPDMFSVEKSIRGQLLSTDPNVVKDGLSNVLYWGYATQPGRQSDRVRVFRNRVTEDHLRDCMSLFGDLASLEPNSIRNAYIDDLPEFRLAFRTKIFAFLDTERFVVLDAQLGYLKGQPVDTLFGQLRPRAGKPGGYLDLQRANVDVYREWCQFCVNVAHTNPELNARAVDVERGIYQMVRQGRLAEAAEIVRSAE